jgi:hypothetical protein
MFQFDEDATWINSQGYFFDRKRMLAGHWVTMISPASETSPKA